MSLFLQINVEVWAIKYPTSRDSGAIAYGVWLTHNRTRKLKFILAIVEFISSTA